MLSAVVTPAYGDATPLSLLLVLVLGIGRCCCCCCCCNCSSVPGCYFTKLKELLLLLLFLCCSIPCLQSTTGAGYTPLFAAGAGVESWVLLLLKALAKHCGSYAALEGRGMADWLFKVVAGRHAASHLAFLTKEANITAEVRSRRVSVQGLGFRKGCLEGAGFRVQY